MAKDLARFVQDYPNFRRELAQRYACAEDGEIRDLLEETLAKTPDRDAVLSMIKAFARDGCAFLGATFKLRSATWLSCAVPQIIRLLPLRSSASLWPTFGRNCFN